jgi:hypothetical protein
VTNVCCKCERRFEDIRHQDWCPECWATRDATPTSARVSGHTLIDEGSAYNANGKRPWSLCANAAGYGKCSCGALSPELPSKNARKRWHRAHKAEVLAAAAQDDGSRGAIPADRPDPLTKGASR